MPKLPWYSAVGFKDFMKGWNLAQQEVAQQKQQGFQERGLELSEQRFGLEEEKWDIMGPLSEARTEKLGEEEPVSIKDRLIQKIYEQGAGSLAPGELALAYGLDILDRPTTGKGADQTAYIRNQLYDLGMLKKGVTREQQATGVPQGPEAIRRMAEERFMQKKYGAEGTADGLTIGSPAFERLYQSMLKGLPSYTPVEQRPTRQQYLERIRGEGGGTKEVATEGAPQNRQELFWQAKAQGIQKFIDREGLKKALPWVTDEDLDWIEDNL